MSTIQASRTILNIANALEEDRATYYELEPLYNQAIGLAIDAKNPKLEATALNSLAVLQETNGFLEKSRACTNFLTKTVMINRFSMYFQKIL